MENSKNYFSLPHMPPALPPVEHAVLALLRAHPTGLGEYEILKALQQQGCAGFPAVSLCEPLALFQMHFLLYHVLYCLRERLWTEQSGHLDINALNIRLHGYTPGQAALSLHDPLRDYYLDLRHWHETGEAQVKELLGAFWHKFHAGAQRQAALKLLDLHEPASRATITRRYRVLAMRYHPDRGGDAEMFRALQAAKEILDAS
jgi:hypothetical protein